MKIELQNIHMSFGNKFLFQGLNIWFEGNRLNCILGHSGSGKTTILKIIAGIAPKFKGQVFIDGQDVTSLPPGERGIGWVPQSQVLFPSLNVKENVSYGLIARGYSKEEQKNRIAEIAKLTGISELLERDVNTLSGGEKQRIALARALAPEPDILLLDESLSNLDAPERDRLALAIREIQLDTQLTIIHVTHAIREAELISDRTVILSNGQVLQEGSIVDIINQPNSSEIARLLNLPNIIEGEKLGIENELVLIPDEAILLDEGDTSARVLAHTRDTVYLQVGEMKLEKKIQYPRYKPGSIVKVGLDESLYRMIKKKYME